MQVALPHDPSSRDHLWLQGDNSDHASCFAR
jgi:hypothetical protein